MVSYWFFNVPSKVPVVVVVVVVVAAAAAAAAAVVVVVVVVVTMTFPFLSNRNPLWTHSDVT